MSLKNDRAPFLCYFKLCASFHSYLSIQNGVTVRKHQIRVKIGNFVSPMNLKIDRWPWKTIEHLFYATSSFHYHQSIQSGVRVQKRPTWVKIGDFLSLVSLKFDRWPQKTIFNLKLQSGNAQLGSKSAIFCPMWPWNLTDDLKKNRAPFLCYFKLCASFHSHL